VVLALCNLPKDAKAIIEANLEPLRVLDLALQDSDRDLSIRFNFVCNRIDVRLAIKYRVFVLVFKWSVWDSKEGHWANGICA